MIKLLLIAVFVLPSLMPVGFMAQRNGDTLALEIALCPSVFNQFAIDALSGPASVSQNHHAHHPPHHHPPQHHAPVNNADQSDAPSGELDHASHKKGEAAELCPLAGPGAFVVDNFTNDGLISLLSLADYSEQTLDARVAALLPPPVRGPPTFS